MPLPLLLAGAVLFYGGVRVGVALRVLETDTLAKEVRAHIAAQQQMQCIWVRADTGRGRR